MDWEFPSRWYTAGPSHEGRQSVSNLETERELRAEMMEHSEVMDWFRIEAKTKSNPLP